MIRAAIKLLLIYSVLWFLSVHWDGAYQTVLRSLELAGNAMADRAPAIRLASGFFLVSFGWMLLQLPLWRCAIRVDRLRGPLRHPFPSQVMRRHLRLRTSRFFAIFVLQVFGLLMLLRALPVVAGAEAIEAAPWVQITASLADRETWLLYGLIHLVSVLVSWVTVRLITEAFVVRRHNDYGFIRYQFERAPVQAMLGRVVVFGLFPVAAFAATSHGHPMHVVVVIAYLMALLVLAALGQLWTLLTETGNERWLRQLDAGYRDNDAVAALRARTLFFLHPERQVLPEPVAAEQTRSEASEDDPWAPAAPGRADATATLPGEGGPQDTGGRPGAGHGDTPGATDCAAVGSAAIDPVTPAANGRWRPVYRFAAAVFAASTLLVGAAFCYQWLVLPSAEQTRILAASAHVHVRRSASSPPEVSLLGTRYDYSLNTGLDNVSQHFINAVIASEDHRFFEHGVTYKLSKFAQAALRCIWRALSPLSRSSGCRGNSTIGQQLARNLFISEERSLVRKFKELVWAIKMEFGLSKQEILQAYVNRIYLGNGNFGVEMAARSYFGKSAAQLGLYESVLLAAAVKRPRWNWHQDRTGAIRRAKTILLVMRRYGYAAPTARFPAQFAPRTGFRSARKPYLGHLWQWIKPRVEQVMATLPPGDYKLLTTLNAELQVYAYRRLSDAIRRMRARGIRVSQGAAVLMRPNGAVLAMVGGVGDDLSGRGTNRAKRTSGLYARPPASAFKPLVYLAALEKGLTPDAIIHAGPVSIAMPGAPPYAPVNHDGKTYGDVSVRDALVKSINTAAVHLLKDEVGFDHLFDVASRLGLDTSGFRRQWGMALGQGGVPVVDLTGAYATFANGGFRVVPHAFVAVTGDNGKRVWRRSRTHPQRLFDTRAISQLNDMLSQAVSNGTGFRATRRFGPQARIAGKTGTGDSFVDAWFVGYSADLVIAVWLGNDQPTTMKDVYGGGAPARIFNEILHDVHEYTDLVDLSRPLP